MAQRKTMPKLHLPCYDLEDVPAAARDLSSSVVVRLREREHWMESLSEMLLLCNEAAARRVAKFGLQKKNSDGTQTKPLGLEYMADRLDTDDPLEGNDVFVCVFVCVCVCVCVCARERERERERVCVCV